jgi:hypothetical protein
VPAPSRNGPCPCGSKLKYKKCCLAKDEAARLAAAPQPPPGRRVIYHRGRPLLISGNSDLPPGVLDHAVDFYEAKDRGEGPAAQMMRFVQPLIEATGGDERKMDRALTLGMAFWNLAICDDERREDMLGDLTRTIARTDEDEREFRALAADMVARHRAMFPALHRP